MRQRILFLSCGILATVGCFLSTAHAQVLPDAIRLSQDPLPDGTRAMGMGGAMIASVNDYTALEWNPAALAPLTASEMGLQLFYLSHNSNALFLGNPNTSNSSNTSLGSLGIATSIPMMRGHVTYGISFDRSRDYTNSYSFKAINPNSSFLNTQNFLADPGSSTGLIGNDYRSYLDGKNLAWILHLTRDVADSNQVLRTPFAGGLEQSGTVTEEGGLNALRVGGAIDISQGISVGGTVNIFFGSYDYRRVYNETDVNGIFAAHPDSLPPLNFQSAQIIDHITQTQSGVNVKVGMLAYQNPFVRFGLTLESPTYFHIDEQYDRTGSAKFRGGQSYSSADATQALPSTINTFEVYSPFKFGLGVSGMLAGATLSASATYQDMSQMRFYEGAVNVSDLNDSARLSLKGVLAFHLGAEYIIPILGLSVRAGFSDEPSPYKGDVNSGILSLISAPNYDIKTWSLGLGLLLSKDILLEAAYRRLAYHTNASIYNDLTQQGQPASANITDNSIKQDQISLSFGYRF